MAIMPDLVKPGSRRKRWILIAVAAVVVLGGIVAAAICCWPVTPITAQSGYASRSRAAQAQAFSRIFSASCVLFHAGTSV